MTNSSSRSEGRLALLALAALAALTSGGALVTPLAAAAGAGLLAVSLVLLAWRLPKARQPEADGTARADDTATLQEAVAAVTTLLDGAFRGDLESRLAPVPEAEPGRRLAIAANDLLDVVDAFARESRVSVETVAAGRYHRRFLARGLDGAFARAASVITESTVQMGDRNRHFGELTGTFEADVLAVARDLDRSAASLGADAQAMIASMGQAGHDAGEIDAEAGASARAALEVRETGAALDAALRAVAESAGRARALGEEATQAVAGSRASVGRLLEAAERIGHVVDMIRSIAEQTNLLAVNAMIEAARSGQAGAGFAVVAREVQALAHQSQGAASDIAGEIRNAQVAAKETAKAIDSVETAVGSMTRETVDAADAIEREAGSVGIIVAEIGSVSGRAETVSRLAGGVATAVGEAREKSEAVGREADDVLRRVRHLGSRLSEYLTSARAA
jgi:methyl-accepting chemotaxis protein